MTNFLPLYALLKSIRLINKRIFQKLQYWKWDFYTISICLFESIRLRNFLKVRVYTSIRVYTAIRYSIVPIFITLGYIDRVRQLQQDNQRLNNLVEKYEKHESEETIKIKKVYDNQIEDLKTALDTMDRQFNELKINENGLHQENADMKNKLRKKDADIGKANERNGILMEDMRQLANQLSILESEKSKIQQQLQETIPELQTLQGKLADAKKTIDAEQLKNADLKNTYSRLEEDHAFKIQMLESEVQKVVEISRIEKEKIEDRTTQQYEERLQKALEQLRDVYETKVSSD